MKQLKAILSCTFLAAVVCPAVAEPGHYAISTEQIAATVSRMGVQVLPEQVTLLTDVVATKVSPALKVRSIERWSNERMMARLECENREECLPFFVGLRMGRGSTTASTGNLVEGSPLFSSGPAGSSKAFVVRSGSPATLMLDSDRVHIRLSVICLENGSPGQVIRVTGKDHRLVFTAQVIDGSLLKGRL
jgi:hypothetical protein